MATTTPRIGLTKPDGTDLVDIAVLNTNFDKIDSNIASTKTQPTKPTTANAGDLWWDSDTGTLYVYYVGASSSSWVAATSDPINIGVVANQTERDAQYPTPAQGMRVFRTDLGVTQTYYGLYNVSTNPGGRDTAGWYSTEKTGSYVPVKVPTVTVAGAGAQTAVANAMGVINFANASGLTLDGIFTSEYSSYKIILKTTCTAQTDVNSQFRRNGVTIAESYYGCTIWAKYNATYGQGWSRNYASFAYFGNTRADYATVAFIDINAFANRPQYNINWFDLINDSSNWGGYEMANPTYNNCDGVIFGPASGLMTGSIQILGLVK